MNLLSSNRRCCRRIIANQRSELASFRHPLKNEPVKLFSSTQVTKEESCPLPDFEARADRWGIADELPEKTTIRLTQLPQFRVACYRLPIEPHKFSGILFQYFP